MSAGAAIPPGVSGRRRFASELLGSSASFRVGRRFVFEGERKAGERRACFRFCFGAGGQRRLLLRRGRFRSEPAGSGAFCVGRRFLSEPAGTGTPLLGGLALLGHST